MTEESRTNASVANLERLSDRELLERFADGDERAFQLLVERHAALVFRACRAVLRHHQDAEDAFQATFLVLAKKARKVSWQRSIGNWLYTTAHRISLKASVRIYRQRAQAMDLDPVDANGIEDLAGYDAERALHEELNQLHERHRVPLVLCYLQGMTYEEAAGALGLTTSTLNGRLQRARQQLRVRLVRRGLGLAVPAAAGTLSAQTAGAAAPAASAATGVSHSLITSTARAASDFASGTGTALVRPEALSLAKGETAMISSMFVKQTAAGTAAALLVMSCLLLSGNAAAEKPEEVPIVETQIPAGIQAEGSSAVIAQEIPAGESKEGNSDVYHVHAGEIRLVGSHKTNTVAVFSAATGRWHKQSYEPDSGEQAEFIVGDNIAVFQAGNHVYAFSGPMGVWDSFEVPDGRKVQPVFLGGLGYPRWVEVEVDGTWYAFSPTAPTPEWVRTDLEPVAPE